MAKKHSGKTAHPIKPRSEIKQSSASGVLVDVAGLILIFCLVLIAYYPSLNGGFLWFDGYHVTAPALQSLRGLWRIWTDPGTTSQYFPLLHSAFWLEHRLWGESAQGYHLLNLILHSLSAFLVVLVVRRLRLPGAWLAGLIFALHPVCVESVAWISEQKNTLSTAFYLAAGLAFLRFDDSRKRSHYFWAAGCFVLALLCKSTTATLPLAILIVLWWRHGRLAWKRDFLPLLPWICVGAADACFAAWVEKTYSVTQNLDPALSLAERFLLSGRTFWFYLSKLVWPADLAFLYPRFKIEAGTWHQYLYTVSLLALLAVFWTLRSRWRGPLAGLLFFLVTLFPVLGIMGFFQTRDSFVADSFQYVACLGVLIPIASGLAMTAKRMSGPGFFEGSRRPGKRKGIVAGVFGGLLLLTLGVLTWRQSSIYRDQETFWRAAIAANPASSMPYNNLGDILLQQQRADEALKFCRMAVALKPGGAEENANLANVLRYKQQLEEAAVYYRKASKLKPNFASFHGGLATTLVDLGKIKEAIDEYETAIRLDPTNGLVANNLAWILATCPDASLRNGKRALELATRSVQLIGDGNPTVLGTLAASYAEVGQFQEAVSAAEKARTLSLAVGDSELVEWHSLLLGTYQTGQAHRESSLKPR
jgi:Flp pilus assembly protein TadD